MRLIRRSMGTVLVLACVAAGCSGGSSPGPSTPPSPGSNPPATGGSGAEGTGGGGGPVTGTGGSGGGGTPITADAAVGGTGGGNSTPDASTGPAADAAPLPPGNTPMSTDGGPQPSYEGEIPIYHGAEVGPKVTMDCPEDPTAGWTEYQDSFHIERPYDVPINTRFSITNGIYNHWVFPGDKPHSTNAKGRNPRTEARYGGTADAATGHNFQHGERMYSADMLIEKNAVGSAIMQIHTTAQGGGPIGVRVQGNSDIVNNGSLTVVQGSSVQGGLIDKWFNYKASLNADTLEVKIYINNCLKSTYTGQRGSGAFYFKNGVYFC